MVFNLKGLMESVRPVDIGIGAFERINQKFRDDEKLDSARAQVVTTQAADLLAEAEADVLKINKRKDRYNTIAERFSPEIADIMGQQGMFTMFDDVKDLTAIPELDIRAREIRNDYLRDPQSYSASENPYMADTEAALISQINEMKESLNASNNIPENTFAIAAAVKEFENILADIQGKKTTGVVADAPFAPNVPGRFDISVNENVKDRIILDNIKTAQFLRVNFFDENQMAQIGLPVVSKADAGRLFGIGNPVPSVADVEAEFKGQMNQDRLLGEMNEAQIFNKYSKMYTDNFYKAVEGLVEQPLGALPSEAVETTVAAFLPDRKFAIRQNYINQVRRANPGISEEEAINALLNDERVGYIFKLL